MKTYLIICNTAFLKLFLILIAGLISADVLASEVYSWTDKDGVIHFGDTAPAGQAVQVIDLPESRQADPADSTPAVDATRESTRDVEEGTVLPQAAEPLTAGQEKRKEMAENREEHRKAQAEAALLCQKHRRRLVQMEPSRRVFYTDEAGETVRMDDDERMGMIEEDKAFIADNCE